jgi:RNA polymerase sigma-70 factor (ECF subfamily)
MSDAQIIGLYLERNENAIAESDRHYGSYCRKIALNVLCSREDADECVNDTWLRAWQHIPPQIPQSLSAFFGKIVRNLSLSRYRRENAQKRFGGLTALLSEFEDCVPDFGSSVEKSVESRLITQAIDDWLASLSKDERVMFVRRYWFAEAVKDLAGEYGCSANTMAQKMMNLRRSLKSKLEQEGIEI